MKVFKIKKGNEFIEIHKKEDGSCFVLFGAEQGTARKFYEMNLSETEISDLKSGFDKPFVNDNTPY